MTSFRVSLRAGARDGRARRARGVLGLGSFIVKGSRSSTTARRSPARCFTSLLAITAEIGLLRLQRRLTPWAQATPVQRGRAPAVDLDRLITSGELVHPHQQKPDRADSR